MERCCSLINVFFSEQFASRHNSSNVIISSTACFSWFANDTSYDERESRPFSHYLPINRALRVVIKTATSVHTLPASLYATRCVSIMTPNAHRPNDPAGMPDRILRNGKRRKTWNNFHGNYHIINRCGMKRTSSWCPQLAWLSCFSTARHLLKQRGRIKLKRQLCDREKLFHFVSSVNKSLSPTCNGFLRFISTADDSPDSEACQKVAKREMSIQKAERSEERHTA